MRLQPPPSLAFPPIDRGPALIRESGGGGLPVGSYLTMATYTAPALRRAVIQSVGMHITIHKSMVINQYLDAQITTTDGVTEEQVFGCHLEHGEGPGSFNLAAPGEILLLPGHTITVKGSVSSDATLAAGAGYIHGYSYDE